MLYTTGALSGETHKDCKKCKAAKPTSAFTKDTQKRDGLASYCRECIYSASKASGHAAQKRFRKNNPEKIAAYKRAAYWRDPEAARTQYMARYYANRESMLAAQKRNYEKCKPKRLSESRAWALKNWDRVIATKRAWKERNPSSTRADRAYRRCMEHKSCPAWADRAELRRFYMESRRLTEETGVLHHVDHVLPIRNKHICGLHVPVNLAVIPAGENMRKTNKFEPYSAPGLAT